MQLAAQERGSFQDDAAGSGVGAPVRPRNEVLAALSPEAFSIIESSLQRRDYEERSVLWDAGQQADRLYFPLSGIISIVMPVKDGNGIEVGAVGHEGCAGIDSARGQTLALTRGIVQVAGTFMEMSATQFAAAARRNDELNN